MRKATTMETGATRGSVFKNKKSQHTSSNRDSNTMDDGGIEDALTWVEDNIPTTIADHALQVFDSEDEVANTELQRSKIL